MATRQYIGARYVPKFYENSLGTAEWQAGVIYEPLTIVTYNGNSYTSKKTVPANIGNPSSNTSYWVATGVFNEQLAHIENEIVDIQNSIDTISSNVNSFNKVIVCGDSYAKGGDYIWYPTFAQLIADVYGGTCKNCAVSGTAAADMSYNNCIVNEAVDSEVTAVVLAGGYNENEATPMSNIENGLSSFIALAKMKFPNAKIYIGFIGWNFLNTSAGMARRLGLGNKALPAYTKVAKDGAVYLAGVENILHNRNLFLTSDYVHPNQTGAEYLGRGIFEAVTCGKCTVKYESETATVVNYGGDINSQGNVLTLGSYLDNDIVSVAGVDQWRCVFTEPRTIAINEQITLAEIEFTHFQSIGSTYGNINCSAVALDSSYNRIIVPGYVTLNEFGRLIFVTNNFTAIPNVTSIFFRFQHTSKSTRFN